MKVDLHFHFRRRRDDRIERLQNMVKKSERLGTRGIILLDHDYFLSEEEMEVAKKAAPLVTFFRGCELTIRIPDSRVKTHLVIASDTPFPMDISQGLYVGQLGAFAELAAREDVLTMLAHPFRKNRMVLAMDFDVFIPDLIDGFSRTSNPFQLRRVAELAVRYNMGLATASDAHGLADIGRYWMDFSQDVATVKDLKNLVQSSSYRIIVE